MSPSQLLKNFLNFREFEAQLFIKSILIRKNECTLNLISVQVCMAPGHEIGVIREYTPLRNIGKQPQVS